MTCNYDFNLHFLITHTLFIFGHLCILLCENANSKSKIIAHFILTYVIVWAFQKANAKMRLYMQKIFWGNSCGKKNRATENRVIFRSQCWSDTCEGKEMGRKENWIGRVSDHCSTIWKRLRRVDGESWNQSNPLRSPPSYGNGPALAQLVCSTMGRPSSGQRCLRANVRQQQGPAVSCTFSARDYNPHFPLHPTNLLSADSSNTPLQCKCLSLSLWGEMEKRKVGGTNCRPVWKFMLRATLLLLLFLLHYPF